MPIELEEPRRGPAGRTGSGGGMKCPVCDTTLVMAERQGIEIDYCPQCRGVWLDRGELDKIIERSMADLAPPPQGKSKARDRDRRDEERYDDRSDDRPYRKGKHGRRKSWLHEMFDLFD